MARNPVCNVSKAARRGRAALTLGVAVALFAIVACQKRGVTFTLTFQDPQGVSIGTTVTRNAMEIGKVTGVETDPATRTTRVTVEIDGRYRESLYREASFSIVRRDLMRPGSGERTILVEDRGTSKTPIADGDVIPGAEEVADPTLRSVTHAIDTARKAVNDSQQQREAESDVGK